MLLHLCCWGCRAMGHFLAEAGGWKGQDVSRQGVLGREQLVFGASSRPCQALRGCPPMWFVRRGCQELVPGSGEAGSHRSPDQVSRRAHTAMPSAPDLEETCSGSGMSLYQALLCYIRWCPASDRNSGFSTGPVQLRFSWFSGVVTACGAAPAAWAVPHPLAPNLPLLPGVGPSAGPSLVPGAPGELRGAQKVFGNHLRSFPGKNWKRLCCAGRSSLVPA